MNLNGAKNDLFSGLVGVGTSGGSSTAVGDALEGVAGSLLSGVPFIGGFLTEIFGKMKIGENINLVKKYGWSSWGASTSPERSKALFAEIVYPRLTRNWQSINPENMGAVLTELYAYLMMQKRYSAKLRKHHSRAGSTKKAHDWAQQELARLIQGGVMDVVSKVRSKGVKVTTESYKGNASDFSFIAYDVSTRTLQNHDVLGDNGNVNSPITLKRFVVDSDSVRNLQVDEKGQVKTDGGGNFVALAGIAFAAFKMFK